MFLSIGPCIRATQVCVHIVMNVDGWRILRHVTPSLRFTSPTSFLENTTHDDFNVAKTSHPRWVLA